MTRAHRNSLSIKEQEYGGLETKSNIALVTGDKLQTRLNSQRLVGSDSEAERKHPSWAPGSCEEEPECLAGSWGQGWVCGFLNSQMMPLLSEG